MSAGTEPLQTIEIAIHTVLFQPVSKAKVSLPSNKRFEKIILTYSYSSALFQRLFTGQ
jgi:hypothetical protein